MSLDGVALLEGIFWCAFPRLSARVVEPPARPGRRDHKQSGGAAPGLGPAQPQPQPQPHGGVSRQIVRLMLSQSQG
jgi:hypothetical protein